ncbi:MAG: ABC transporter permease, partial [Reyranella sp.]
MAGSTPASLTADAPASVAAAPRKRGPTSPWQEAWRRFRRHRLAVASGVV